MKAMPRRDAISGLGALSAMALFSRTTSAQIRSDLSLKDSGSFSALEFSPPLKEMHFSRTLIRDLLGGAKITVSRVWAVRFEPVGEEYSLGGRQVSVEVLVPPKLERLADLERSRQESGLFPMMLSRTGLIVSKSIVDQPPQLERAIEKARQTIQFEELASGNQRSIDGFLRTLQASAEQTTSRLPRDLFSPRKASWTDERQLELPSRLEGGVTIRFTAENPDPMGLLKKASRTVTTRIGNSLRQTVEHWSLQPA